MNEEIIIARIRNPYREEFYLDFFEFEGTIHEFLITLIDLDKELTEMYITVRGFLIFPRSVGEEIIKRYIAEDENLRQVSMQAVYDYYPGFTNEEMNPLLDTTEYIVANVKRYYSDLIEIPLGYQNSYITIVYFRGSFVQGELKLHKVAQKQIEYELSIYGSIEDELLRRETTFKSLVQLIESLSYRQGKEKTKELIKIHFQS